MMKKYNLPMRLMHWTSGVLFLFNLGLGYVLADTNIFKDSPSEISYILLHKSFGSLVFFLLILRLFIRLGSKLPEEVKFSSWLEKFAAKFTHYALYFFLLEIPLVGYLMSNLSGRAVSFFGLFDLPVLISQNKELAGKFYEIHELSAYMALGFIGLHILATIKHYLFNKENLLKRMV